MYNAAKAKEWSIVCRFGMVVAFYPKSGGAKHFPHKFTITNRNTPLSRKVGQITARRTGHQN